MTSLKSLVFFSVGLVFGVIARPDDRLMSSLKRLSDEELDRLEVALGRLLDGGGSSEEMLGDQPSANETQKSLDMVGGRDRDHRIKAIMQQVLFFVGRNGKENSSLPILDNKKLLDISQIIGRNNESEYAPPGSYTEKVQSFHPVCGAPKNTDEEAWTTNQALNLFFDLRIPAPVDGTAVALQSAKLRLYKISQPVIKKEEEKVTIRYPPVGHALPVEDHKIRVSAYWYTRALKKNRAKRKLLDSIMLSVYGNEWIELNINPAVNSWKDSGKNFGIAVEVEDEDRVILSAMKYFIPMNCTASSSEPIPGLVVDAMQNGTFHVGNLKVTHYPTIDLATITYPKPSQVFVHKLRHNHTRHWQQHSTQSPANDSMEQIAWQDPSKSPIR